MWKADITVKFEDGSIGACVQDSAYKLYAMKYADNMVTQMIRDGQNGLTKRVVSHKIKLTQESM